MSIIFIVKKKAKSSSSQKTKNNTSKESDSGIASFVDGLNVNASYKSSPGISTTFGVPFYRPGDSKAIGTTPVYACGCPRLDPKTGDLLRNKNTGIPYEKPLPCTKPDCDGPLSCGYCHHKKSRH